MSQRSDEDICQYLSYSGVLSSRESCFIPRGGNFLNGQCCCQTKKCSLFSLLERCVRPNLPPQNQHSFTAWGGDLRLPFLQHFLTSFSINSNWNATLCHLTKWLADRNFFFSALWRRAFVFSLEQHWKGVFKLTTHLYLKSFISIRFFFLVKS